MANVYVGFFSDRKALLQADRSKIAKNLIR